VYPFGDLTCGALGNLFIANRDRCKFEKPTSINKRNIKAIYTGDFSSFILSKNSKKGHNRGCVYSFGLNNY